MSARQVTLLLAKEAYADTTIDWHLYFSEQLAFELKRSGQTIEGAADYDALLIACAAAEWSQSPDISESLWRFDTIVEAVAA